MENKTIIFSTGKLIINDVNISFHLKNGNVRDVNTIARENIGFVDKQPMRLLPLTEFVYIFRVALIGVLVTILGLLIGYKIDTLILFYFGIMIIFFAGFLMFSYLWIDSILGLKIATPILLNIFGVDAIRVVIQNIYGGNNLQFLIGKDEINKLPLFDDYKIDKTHSKKNLIKEESHHNYDDIEKLSVLKDKGLITLEEFELKKKQILGL